ncbi:hypothetical protein [Pseudoalteromonas piscicida]|uniref:Uncharacterized protein n=1 Tax=Pseudoalteromonas piscicida TaxID=43662 RepID=A0A2A5JML8_PSEO7|nr:hypothetical protein [Pseudoalteromonas piscicida]PCK30692.1 hypothetical protein CEX98_16210 [Pseudoalteromonas piscicida]
MVEINRFAVNSNEGKITPNKAATEQLKDHRVVPEAPSGYTDSNLTISLATSDISPEADARLKREGEEAFAKYTKEFEKTQQALLTSVDEFARFKEQQKASNPHLNMDSLDLTQADDGSLALVGGNLSGSQREELEAQLNENQTLKDAFSQVHKGLVSVLHYRTSENQSITEKDLQGAIQLNDLTERYSRKFSPDGFGQDYTTLEERIMSDPLLFFGKMADLLDPKINVMA